MIRSSCARATALALTSALMLAPTQSQETPAQGQTSPAEVFRILTSCAAYSTLPAQTAGEEATGPNRDRSARLTRASFMVEAAQNAAVVDDAISLMVGQFLIRRIDASQKAEVDKDFAVLDSSCTRVDTDIVIPLLAEVDASAR